MSIAALADVTEQVFGSPNAFPGTPPSHFFPAVSRQDRERLRQARLADEQQLPASSLSADQATAALAPANDWRSDDARWQRERQAKLNLAAGGPFDNRRPPQQRYHPPDTSYDAQSLPGTSDAEAAAVRALQAGGAALGVGAGGSGGTKRRFRDDDRTSWDAASELVRLERERDLADRTTAEQDEAATRKSSTGTLPAHPFPTVDREKTPTPNTLIPSTAKGKGRAIDYQDEGESPGMVDPGSRDGARRRDSRLSDEAEASEGDEETVMDDEDDASVMTGATGRSAGGNGSDGSGKEPVKKRSRTLTTPAQTAVLNALLAKVSEVGALSFSLRATVLAQHRSAVAPDAVPIDRDARRSRSADRNERTTGSDLVSESEAIAEATTRARSAGGAGGVAGRAGNDDGAGPPHGRLPDAGTYRVRSGTRWLRPGGAVLPASTAEARHTNGIRPDQQRAAFRDVSNGPCTTRRRADVRRESTASHAAAASRRPALPGGLYGDHLCHSRSL